MEKTNKVSNKKIRTIILGIVLLVYVGTTIYVAITKENNKLAGNDFNDVYVDKDYDEDYNDDYEDEYKDNYDEYEEENKEKTLDLSSNAVQTLYSYIENFTYIEEIKGSFEVTTLTETNKMRLVMAALNSQKELPTQTVTDVTEVDLYDNNIHYVAQQPNVKFERYVVMNMYDKLFGTVVGIDYTALMYDGKDVVYKYNESASGYIKYINLNQTQNTPKTKATLTKATKKGKVIELHITNGNKKEVYKFQEIYSYDQDATYKFTGRTSTEEKNSL